MTDRITENDPSPSPVVVVEEEESLEEEESTKQYDGLSKQNPIVRTYLYPPDVSSLKKYFILVFLISGALMFFLGPLAQVFVVEPLVTLLLSDASMITPDKACYNPRLANQTCENEVYVDYYFWNITNQENWLLGLEPPLYQEIGPYSFKSYETRYNLKYDANWTNIEYTYHQWDVFDSERSCEGCTLNDTLITINRAYLQFVASGQGAPLHAEELVVFQNLPSTLKVSFDVMYQYMLAIHGPSAANVNQTLEQWSECATLENDMPLGNNDSDGNEAEFSCAMLCQALQPVLNLTSPYIKDFPGVPASLPFHLEFCQFIVSAFSSQFNISVQPNEFQLYGLNMSSVVSKAFFEIAVGDSNATYSDPSAQQFLYTFLSLSRNDALSYIMSINPDTGLLLSAIDSTTWSLLQGYMLNLMSTGGKFLFQQYLASQGGGLVLHKTLSEWLYGFEDRLLTIAAMQAAQQSGSPSSYKLKPWLYTPSLALSFPSKEAPIEYLSQASGGNGSMLFNSLSWNQSDTGYFLPLVQQKQYSTGKQSGTVPQNIVQYRGLDFLNQTWAIINMTGINEGVTYGESVKEIKPFIAFDSALSRPLMMKYSGKGTKVKKIESLVFELSNSSIHACNWTAYSEWASGTDFDPNAYQDAMNTLTSTEYNTIISNASLLSEYLQSSPLGKDFSDFFGNIDVARDRCAVPDQVDSAWDMSRTFASPTFFSFPKFFKAPAFLVSTTGVASWNSSAEEHLYALAMDPLTGIAVKGHKTYQLNHLVSKTPLIYPTLWTVDGSGAAVGLADDFTTVPVFWIRMWWEPQDSDAMLLRAMSALVSYLYTILVIIWPSLGITVVFSCTLILLFGKEANNRKKEVQEYHRDKSLPLKLSKSQRKRMYEIYVSHDPDARRPILPISSSTRAALKEVLDEARLSSEEEALENVYIAPFPQRSTKS